jgi:hypothetical protein
MAKKLTIYLCSLLIILIIVFISIKLFVKNPTIEIVIARYEEDLSWLHKMYQNTYSKIYIYNKGSPLNIKMPNVYIIDLPNLGRESHTYLHHVIENYNRLPEMTIFIPGSVWAADYKQAKLFKILNSIKTDFRSTILGIKDTKYIEDAKNFTIDSYAITNEENRKKNSDPTLHKSTHRPLFNWFKNHFPGEEISCISANGIMAATRESIQKKTIDFYKQLIIEHSYKNPEVVHYSERTWKNIFSIEKCIEG